MESVEGRRRQESMENLGPEVGWTTLQNRIEGMNHSTFPSITQGIGPPSIDSFGHPNLKESDWKFQNRTNPLLRSACSGAGPGGKLYPHS